MSERTPLLLQGLTGYPREGNVMLSHRELLGRRLFVNSVLRFGVAATFVLGAVLAFQIDVMSARRVVSLLVLGAVVGAYNIPLFVVGRRYRPLEASAAASDRLRYVMAGAIIADFLVLALLVNVMGGARTPFLAFYLPHVALSSVILARRDAIFFTALAFALVAAQVALEWTGLRVLSLPFLGAEAFPPLDHRTAVQILVVYGSLFVLTASMLVSVIDRLRVRERDLRRANDKLDQLSRLRRDFLDVAVHDMRSPVGAALMLLNNLSEGLAGPLQPTQKDWLDRSRLRLERLLELLHDLKTLGDLETEDHTSRTERVSMHSVILRVRDEYAHQAEAVGNQLVVITSGSSSDVMGVPRLLQEAVANLVTNALRYAPHSGPVVMSTERMTIGGRDWIRTSVTDRGPGIPEEGQQRLFDEFARGTQAKGSDGVRGTGLGLSIVRRIVEAHGGTVGVESKPGLGSAFYLDLPECGPESQQGGGQPGE